MPSDSNRIEVKEEGNLLIEAVSLLVQRQRESESWVADQIWQAEERAAAAERHYAELEVRLADIEEHLARLAQDVEPVRGDAAVDERLARLREQVEGLKSAADGRPARTAAVGPTPAEETVAPEPAATPRPVRGPEPGYAERPAPRPARASTTSAGVGFWELLGQNPQERYGLALIGVGLIAVVYAVLTQLRF